MSQDPVQLPAKTMFFAYPWDPPLLRELIAKACHEIEQTGLVNVVRWEDLRRASGLLISDIAQAIDTADASAFVLTDLNPNVMFELGYGIGAKKHVWLLLDPSRKPTKAAWDRFNLLSPVRYVPYQSASDIQGAFLTDLPHEDVGLTIFEDVIEPSLTPVAPNRLFYMKSTYQDEAARHITRRIERSKRSGWELTIADPTESIYTITWYARQVYSAEAVIIHLAPQDVVDAEVHNAKCALIGGLAYGMGRPLLMLAEENFRVPIDYMELLKRYPTAAEGARATEHWIKEHRHERTRDQLPVVSLRTELQTLRLGEDVAENEEDRLSEYFIETASYLAVLEKRTTIFVGRKGTGKTANLIRAAETLADDKRNLVVVIKPSGYEVEAVARLLAQDLPGDIRSYLLEGLWEYLLETETALAAVEEARRRPAGFSTDSPEWRLATFLEHPDSGADAEFAVRLEVLVHALSEVNLAGGDIAQTRADIMQVLHAGVLGPLRARLRPVLAERSRVCILIDNLDRAWDKATDIEHLSSLFLGLLVAIGRLGKDFRKAGIEADLSLALFLRTDIFHHVRSVAREPDKLPASEILWSDSDLLVRLVETRYASAHEGVSGAELWTRFFCPTVAGVETKRYITSRILPRPRDMVHFCNGAIVAAVNAGHGRIEEEDIVRGEQAYSQFACDAIRVENGISIRELDEILLQFMGSEPRVSQQEAADRIISVGVPPDSSRSVIGRLRDLSFLGLEVRQEEFRYSESPEEARKAEALGARLEQELGRPPMLEVHPAFRAYLEIVDP